MKILAIDPGLKKSGVVLYEPSDRKVLVAREIENEELCTIIVYKAIRHSELENSQEEVFNEVVIEDMEGQGYAVGKDVFDTAKWIGDFRRAWKIATGGYKEAHLISRGDIKIVVCGKKTFINQKTGKRKEIGDPQIRAALIDKFPATGGGKTPQIGTKAKPGPLYGMKNHCWPALAVAVTYLET